MKPATKIFLSCLVIIISTFCVAMFLSRSNSVVLVVYNPITNVTSQYKVESGNSLGSVAEADSLDGYTFVGYYSSTDFSKEISSDSAITSNATIVLGYSQTISDVADAVNGVVGVQFVGDLPSQTLSQILDKNYRYLDLSLASNIVEFTPYNTSLRTLILPQGNICNINNYTSLQTVKIEGLCNIENSFNNCPELCSVDIADCTQINSSFNNCEKLEAFNLSASLENLEDSFINTHLSSITNFSNNFVLENGVLYGVNSSDVVAKKAVSSLENLNLSSLTTQIDDYAFYKHPNLKTVLIDAKVWVIGQSAFYGSKIEELNIVQNNVLTIQKDAFRNCDSLEIVDFGKGIETMEEFAFYNSAIKQLNFETSVLSNVGAYAFASCGNLQNVKFLDKQITLGKGAFSNCTNLSQVSHLNTQTLSEKVFENCRALTNLSNIYNVQSVENYAFSNCSSLADITELATIKTVGMGCFQNCILLEEAKFLNLENLSDNLFLNCNKLTTFVSAQNLLEFAPTAFDGCDNLETLSFSSDNFVNENGVVYNASQTQLLYYLPTKTDTIFTLKSTLETVNVKYVAANNFLEEIKTDSSNFEVQDGVLFSADKQTLLCYPSGKTESSYTVPEFVVAITKYAFVQSPNLTNLTILQNVQTLQSGFLWQNSGLTALTTSFVGESTNNLSSCFLGWFFGADSFEKNNQYVSTNLKEVVVNNQQTFLNHCFYDCENLLTIKLENCSQVPQNMFYNCYSLQTLLINKPLQKIEDYALYNCKSLININLIFNSALTASDIKSTALLNTPKGVKVKVEIYSDTTIENLNIQFTNFRACFKEKRYDWNWTTLMIN